MNRRKVLKAIYKTFEMKNINDLLDDFISNNDERTIKPEKKTKHIGLEIECFGKSRRVVQALIFEHDLGQYVQIGEDSSIQRDSGYADDYELRCLIPQNKLHFVLAKLGKVFKTANIHVNDSCGLHVHLDMRTRDVNECYEKLIKFQNLMFSLVDEDRWENDYCKYANVFNRGERYNAINIEAYHRHKTIEIRLHHGTTNVKVIENWVNLLLKIIDSRLVKDKIYSKEKALVWSKKSKKINNYIKSTSNNTWFYREGERE